MEYLEWGNLALSLCLLVAVLLPTLRHRAAAGHSLAADAATTPPASPTGLPEGHEWPEKADEFDGVWERWVCREHGESHLRRRP